MYEQINIRANKSLKSHLRVPYHEHVRTLNQLLPNDPLDNIWQTGKPQKEIKHETKEAFMTKYLVLLRQVI